ncbi:nucleoside 2-deoxyribosyltransferase [Acetobacteraceae bacterium H6797]|nr:nucleoside 2-deoxyribosyltransferase [Acetobacteraceae bacterium H6797]
MTITAYLAGPDLFLPGAVEHAARKVAICARFGIAGRPPLNEEAVREPGMSDDDFAHSIFRKDVRMMTGCDIVIANLTPFRGPSADSGTLVEIGWFLGQGRKIFAYSNSARTYAERCRVQAAAIPDPIPGLMVEGLGMPDNLMIPGAVQQQGGIPMVIPEDGRDRAFDSLEIFELCVARVAKALGLKEQA